jgi:hypothetical protein
MLWSPIVKARKNTSEYDQMNHLQQVKENILNDRSEDIQFIINEEFSNRLKQLRDHARKTTANLKSPVMRMLQIEEQVGKRVAKK